MPALTRLKLAKALIEAVKIEDLEEDEEAAEVLAMLLAVLKPNGKQG
jgi:predicted protein tyrosine phosphatase